MSVTYPQTFLHFLPFCRNQNIGDGDIKDIRSCKDNSLHVMERWNSHLLVYYGKMALAPTSSLWKEGTCTYLFTIPDGKKEIILSC